MFSPDLASVPDMRGKTTIVNASNIGIGFATAKVLAERGARVALNQQFQGFVTAIEAHNAELRTRAVAIPTAVMGGRR